jgi:phosphoglycolate phosphatase
VTPANLPGAVLFDLDGTLLDTAPDMIAALNALRRAEGLTDLPYEQLRGHVSHGAIRLIERGFQLEPGPRFEELRLRFLDLYSQDLAVDTRLFGGLDEVLNALEALQVPWGVVTNKPGWLTEPLMAAVGLAARAGCIVCGDTLPERKPSPAPLLHAAAQLQTTPATCVYVGDAERDVQAGRAAGMRTLVAGFGYIGPDEDPRTWQADAIVARPDDLLDALNLRPADELPPEDTDR